MYSEAHKLGPMQGLKEPKGCRAALPSLCKRVKSGQRGSHPMRGRTANGAVSRFKWLMLVPYA